MRNYVHRFPLEYPKNMHFKSIVQPKKVSQPYNPHIFNYKEPWYCVDENYYPLPESQGPFTAEKIQLNHYYFRSQQDYCQKLERGRADRVDDEGKRHHNAFFHQLEQAVVFDASATKFANDLDKYNNVETVCTEMKRRHDEKTSLSSIIDFVIRSISLGKLENATALLKKAKILGADQLQVDYLQYRIAKKRNDSITRQHLIKMLRNCVDLDICCEYANYLASNNQNVDFHNMLLYIKWRFAKEIGKDVRLADKIEKLSDKIGSQDTSCLNC